MKIIRNIFFAVIFLSMCKTVSAASPEGEIIGWGNAGSGQVTGVSTATRPYLTTNVMMLHGQVLTDATAVVASGYYNSLALKSDGTVAGWGYNNFGQATGVSSVPTNGLVVIEGQTLSNVTAIDAEIALKNDKTLVTWGANSAGHKIDVPPDLTNVIAIATGLDHFLVLKKDGMLFSLGAGSVRQIGVSNIIAIAAGQGYGFGAYGDELALKSDGSVVGWSMRKIDHEESLPKELTSIIAIASGGGHYLALTKDGTVFGWGINDKGQATGIPTTNHLASGFVSIDGHTLNGVIAIATGGDCSLALKKDGTVVAWGRIGFQPATVPDGLSNVVAIATSGGTCLAITTNAAVAEKFRH